MGIILLVALCAVTDWTIRLIVVNAKMSGRKSYIAIMDHCFGGSGRAAVSLFQFTMAFGGRQFYRVSSLSSFYLPFRHVCIWHHHRFGWDLDLQCMMLTHLDFFR